MHKAQGALTEHFKVVCIPCKALYKCLALPLPLLSPLRKRKKNTQTNRHTMTTVSEVLH